jgi:hypothetical protein
MDLEGAEFRIFRDSTRWLERVDNQAMGVHKQAGDPAEIVDRLQAAGFKVKWPSDSGYPTSPPDAGYIYASRIGSFAVTARTAHCDERDEAIEGDSSRHTDTAVL